MGKFSLQQTRPEGSTYFVPLYAYFAAGPPDTPVDAGPGLPGLLLALILSAVPQDRIR